MPKDKKISFLSPGLEINFEDPTSGFFVRESTDRLIRHRQDPFEESFKDDATVANAASKPTNRTEESQSFSTTSIVIGSTDTHHFHDGGSLHKTPTAHVLQTAK